MTDAEIAALEDLYEEASPGPWEISPVHRGIHNPVWMVLFPDRKVEPPDANLIVAMHNALPKLIEGLRESRTECERQMLYGVKQHEAAQDAIRERDALRTLLIDLFDATTNGHHIRTHDGWFHHEPKVVLPIELERRVREALVGTHPKWCLVCEEYVRGCTHQEGEAKTT